MLEAIIAWSLSRRIAVLLGAAVVCLVGWVAVNRLVVDAFPDTTPVQVQINTVAPGMVAEEIERQITFPVELAMGGMPGLEGIRSASMFGLSVVIVTFQDGTDIYFARQLINERLGTVGVPTGVERPEMGPVSTGLGEVFHYLLVPRGMSLTDVKTLQEWTLKPALRSVPGTAEVNAWGGLNKQYQIRIDPTLLRKYDLSFDQVVEAIPRNNFNVGGGSIDRSGDAVLVYGVGRTVDIEQIGRIVVASSQGVPIRIRDVGEVVIGHEIRKGAVTYGGEGEVVLGLGFMLMGENSYAVTTRLRDRFEELLETLPEGVEAKVVYDRTKLIDRVIATVRQNLLEGAFLVVVILYVMLGNLRAGLVAATAIPLSMMCGFIGMWQAGISASLLSLGAIDFGIVVDSSVVVIESILEKIGHHPGATGAARLKLVREATNAVKKPACFGQLIIMIVYIPILTLEGVEGKMFRPMALTVVFILIGSLVLSLTVVPVLSSFFLPKRMDSHDVVLVRFLRWLYRPVLRACLAARGTLALIACVILGVTLLRAGSLGTEFVPKLSEGDIVLGIIRAPGTSIEESCRMNMRIEKALLDEFPAEIAHHPGASGAERLRLVREATNAVKKPACFGQLIIMIVYIPILTLEGVEGKMFRPMALTVVFILIGSLVLSLTVVPVLSSIFLPRRMDSHDVLLVRGLRWLYRPLLRGCLAARGTLALAAVVILGITLLRAASLGTEFVPKLSEGDIVLGIIRAPGTSIEESCRMNMRIEKSLLEEFPAEIAHVWSRTGTPEVATDAGAIEATDMFIALKPREEWKRARTQAALVEVMSKVVDGIPGQIIWFTQPIEQRINEMVSGVRADIAVKVFGKDLGMLVRKAEEVAGVLRKIPGGADIAVEQVAGQPILRIAVRQDDIARYGISAQVVLDIIESVGGKAVGEIVEGQLRFPIVVRLPESLRKGPEAIRDIAVRSPAGESVPLERICDIETISGPKFITRE
ncbi:MAG: efflux RND transporter permease subunit, partial [Planctomycetaceae bacterium]